MSHHARKRQHRNRCRGVSLYGRTPPTGFNSRALFSLLVVFLLFCNSLLASVSAAETYHDRPALLVDDHLAWTGSSLYLDHRPSPVVPLMSPLHTNDDDTTTPSKRSINTNSHAADTDFTVPLPFDTGLSNNFTSSCSSFFTRLRTSQGFNNCHPFSLMLQTSSGFFDASKSYLRITQTLDVTCAANATQCNNTMDNFARELVSATACKADYEADSPLVLQAYNGLVAYQPLYQASCLRDKDGGYCFANAVSNTSSPTDSYPYYLPIGQELPGGSRPTCNSCLQQAMGVFAHYGSNATQPVSKTYAGSAQQINIACGSGFAVPAAPLKGAASTTSVSLTSTIALVLMFVLYFFQ
ncbi:hypothetical protein EJ02DRAFT_353053 [Clathrospora elynae]|uniref:DUF7729 domain-containing protein n=1 Tax=Clathrospora elynae TaxID=706981 RepID=A0A6A5SHD1_9PLEO|nr:hypothetical protein EJ02DRAFT_353053 [Clathrospora elynae]